MNMGNGLGLRGTPELSAGRAGDRLLTRCRAPAFPVNSAPSAEKTSREAAEEFVAQALVQPVLKQMRAMNQASPPFAPGPYEKTFAAMLDAEVAKHIVRARRFPVVDAVARQLLEHSRHEGEPAPSDPDPRADPARAVSSETNADAAARPRLAYRRDDS